tara:strand:- start:158 stop:1531 length:1374 start_codon:yes stop_codon:yes gene_type:complete
MCGILVTKRPERGQMIKHRGTESHSFMDKVNEMHFIHYRLPIQTMDNDEWKQPIEIEDSILLFNGEIFNYPDKYDSDIEYLKDFFKGCTDLEYFKRNLFDDYKKWDGFWSIVYYNKRTDTYICFTDPLGKKQLYINKDYEICSEIKPLCNINLMDPAYFGSINKWGYNHDLRTPWLGITRLNPDKIYSWKDTFRGHNTRIVNTVDNFIFIPKSGNLKEILKASVKRRLLSKNYPISVLLSGGLDSTIITAILEMEGADVTYYTIENGESEYVKLCENFYGIKVNRLNYDLADGETIREIYCKWNETPVDLGSVIPQYHLFDAVAKTGHRIVLSGDGADELFGGYRRISEYDSQGSDMYHELTYYHLPRLDRMSMAHTIELRNPFLGHDVIRYALSCSRKERMNKEILKTTFKDWIPKKIIDRSKAPLKNESIKTQPLEYRKKVIDLFKEDMLDYAGI